MVRGGNIRNRPNIRGMRTAFKKAFVPRHPFDQTLAEILFPKVNNTSTDDSALTAVSVYSIEIPMASIENEHIFLVWHF